VVCRYAHVVAAATVLDVGNPLRRYVVDRTVTVIVLAITGLGRGQTRQGVTERRTASLAADHDTGAGADAHAERAVRADEITFVRDRVAIVITTIAALVRAWEDTWIGVVAVTLRDRLTIAIAVAVL
jgi:hypothetical protein